MVFERLDPTRYALPAELTERALSPALVVHLEHVRANVARVVGLCGGDPGRWRAHVKSAKIPRVLAELARAGLSSFKCATTLEAKVLLETLRDGGLAAPDVLVAYPLVGPALARLDALAGAHAGARVLVLCETPEAVREVPARLGVFVDVNPGMDRTGAPLERAGQIEATARAAGERLGGLHFYDGHQHDRDRAARTRAVHAGYDRLLELVRELESKGLAVPELVTAGTPALLDALSYGGFAGPAGPLHRVSPGTVVYHDLRSEEETPELGLVPAALVLARVVSHPADGVVTCDAGSKALAAEAGDPVAEVLGWPELRARTPSEEHLPLAGPADRLPARGELLQLVPRHVCPTVNLASEAALVEGGRLLDVVPVLARGHELLPGRMELEATWTGPRAS